MSVFEWGKPGRCHNKVESVSLRRNVGIVYFISDFLGQSSVLSETSIKKVG